MRTFSDNDNSLYGDYSAWLSGQRQTMIDADYASRHISDYLVLDVSGANCLSSCGDWAIMPVLLAALIND